MDFTVKEEKSYVTVYMLSGHGKIESNNYTQLGRVLYSIASYCALLNLKYSYEI